MAIFGALAILWATAVAQAVDGQAFERTPESGPRGTRISTKGTCESVDGRSGQTIALFVQRTSDASVIAAGEFDVLSNGYWSGKVTIPKIDSLGRQVEPGDYVMRADCEFGDDYFEAEFTYADQIFTVTPGDIPGCENSCDLGPSFVDCANNGACEAGSSAPGNNPGASQSPKQAAASVAAKADATKTANGTPVANAPGTAGSTVAPPDAVLSAGELPVIQLAGGDSEDPKTDTAQSPAEPSSLAIKQTGSRAKATAAGLALAVTALLAFSLVRRARKAV
ncbi:MAG: hypothetical protein ACR2FO_03135 [Actinomycetota bacterium]